jgi:hypothetical protein
MSGPAPPDAPMPPRPDKPASGWQDYEPRLIASSPLRERRRARRMYVVVGTVVAVFIVVAVIAGIAVSRTLTSQRHTCSPAPCADDGSGFQVFVDAVNRSLSMNPVDQPTNGNHIVQVTAHFRNTASVTKPANPLDFTLRDAAGLEHRLVLGVGAQCGVFEATYLAGGSTLGPKVMCFEASGDSQGKLTLLWSPATHQLAIDIP